MKILFTVMVKDMNMKTAGVKGKRILPPLVDPDSGSLARFLSIEDAKIWVDETYLPFINDEIERE